MPSTNATASDCSGALTVALRRRPAQTMAASCEGGWAGRGRAPAVCSCSFVSPEASVIAEASLMSMPISYFVSGALQLRLGRRAPTSCLRHRAVLFSAAAAMI
jgi:hypothetical protein